ncbi:MAG TPA: lipid-A-disaccharide synthase N-terminal domain-containing protein [Planctomycetota bacterium]
MAEFFRNLFSKFGDIPAWLLLLGLGGQAVFMTRFVIQWIASERAGRSVIPIAFWWTSLSGAALLFAYGIFRADPVILLGQSLGFFIYSRNLVLIRRELHPKAGPPSAP